MGKILKPVPADKQKSLGKLPQPVRNKMGFQKDGGKSVKKAQSGTSASPKVSLRSGQYKRLGRLAAKNPMRAEKVGKRMAERATRRQRGVEFMNKNAAKMVPETPTFERGGKARNGKSLSPKGSNVSRRLSSYPKTIGKAKGGMNLGKCRGGCY
jgi:hypothetical protein